MDHDQIDLSQRGRISTREAENTDDGKKEQKIDQKQAAGDRTNGMHTDFA
jgi:hypothetical protein